MTEISEIGEIRTGLERKINSFKKAIKKCVERRKSFTEDYLRRYYDLQDRDFELYAKKYQKVSELLAKKQNDYQPINIIS